ncbi:MAG: hypothetical protein U1F42_01165 [Candidatus Competibacteraceae bacterium]
MPIRSALRAAGDHPGRLRVLCFQNGCHPLGAMTLTALVRAADQADSATAEPPTGAADPGSARSDAAHL